ncbi:hypothetical protein [Streptomyces chartreusis]|uniref:hypothetical protein n=1 Tax=Streptomyces chartreusis TaxID=1969 RepID=UPI002E1758DE
MKFRALVEQAMATATDRWEAACEFSIEPSPASPAIHLSQAQVSPAICVVGRT